MVQDAPDKQTKGLLLWVLICWWLMHHLPQPSFPMLVLCIGRQKVKDNYTKHFLYIALLDCFFQCIIFSLLKPMICSILLKIVELLSSKGIFCLLQFLVLFLLVLMPIFGWILCI